MGLLKQTKDRFIKIMLGKDVVPVGLSELNHYFRIYDPIKFKYEKQDDGSFVAISQNFIYGSIITSGKNKADLDIKVKDAILTAFEVPSSYAKDAAINKIGDKEYAFA